jgi:uncharacterized Tic20 family protein
MNPTTVIPIAPEDRTMAALTHLSGLSGYIVPLGGVLVPIIIWIVKKDSPLISAIARQAVILNLTVFIAAVCGAILLLTVILIPFLILAAIAIGLAAVVLPIVGAIKANDGVYFRYPVVGANP